MTKKTAEEFAAAVGSAPEQDDLERVNCELAGKLGHQSCGWCEKHNKPRFMCGCIQLTTFCVRTRSELDKQLAIDEIKGRDSRAKLDPESNPITFWIATTLTCEDLMAIPTILDVVVSTNR